MQVYHLVSEDKFCDNNYLAFADSEDEAIELVKIELEKDRDENVNFHIKHGGNKAYVENIKESYNKRIGSLKFNSSYPIEKGLFLELQQEYN